MRSVEVIDMNFNGRGKHGVGTNQFRRPASGGLGGSENLVALAGRVSKYLFSIMGRS